MSDEPLKPLPCPWCGAIPTSDDVIGEYAEGVLYVRLRCPNGDDVCMAEGPWVEFGISDNDYPVDAVTLYESSVSAWNRRAEPEELPEWVKLIIMRRINHLQESVDATEYDDNKYAWNFAIEELEDTLSLKKGDS